MRGALAKKIRRTAKLSFGESSAILFRDLLGLPLGKRVKFCYSVLFKRPLRGFSK
jgi:hypothetical protein